MNPNQDERLSRLLDRHSRDSGQLLQILIDVQATFRQVSKDHQTQIAWELNLPRTRVEAVTAFYSFLSETPLGVFDLRLSDSITDHMLGSRELAHYLSQALAVPLGETRSDGRVSLALTSCTGLCDQGPAGLINGRPLTKLNRQRAREMVRLVESDVAVAHWPEEWFEVESRVHREGLLLGDSSRPGESLKRGFALGRLGVLEEMTRSGLRGRGGAGFSTAKKWQFCAETPGAPIDREDQPTRWVVANADEGEPGTFKDRVLLSDKTDAFIEGMTLCAFVIGSRRGFVYLRGEYAFLKPRLEAVLSARRNAGLLGQRILGRDDFDFDIDIHLGAGAYICGEESALIESLEGRRGIPRNRPPYPVISGYRGGPTVVNNVETFVAATSIVLRGGEWFAAQGTEMSKGSKLLSLSGDVERPGVYEYPFGTTLRQILADAGVKGLLGVQVGGPSGVFVGPKDMDRRLGFEDLASGGSVMVFNEERHLLDIVKNFSHFFAHESCGFCTPCRVGTALLRNQFDKIHGGHGTVFDLIELEETARLVAATSHCGLGQTAPNPILSTLARFPESYQAALKASSFEPGFDLDRALADARKMTGRNDPGAHLEPTFTEMSMNFEGQNGQG